LLLLSKWANIEKILISEDGEIFVSIEDDIVNQIDQLIEIS